MCENYTTTWVDFENEYRDKESSIIVEMKTTKISTSREVDLQDVLFKIWSKRDYVTFKDIELLNDVLNNIGSAKFEL